MVVSQDHSPDCKTFGMSHGQATEDAAHNEHVQVQIWLAIFGAGKRNQISWPKYLKKHGPFFLVIYSTQMDGNGMLKFDKFSDISDKNFSQFNEDG